MAVPFRMLDIREGPPELFGIYRSVLVFSHRVVNLLHVMKEGGSSKGMSKAKP